jgi:cytochrome c oxidase assembly factor CtaG
MVGHGLDNDEHGYCEDRTPASPYPRPFTSIHMTRLGALFTLAQRPLYAHNIDGWAGLSQLGDQQLGGAIMLLVGGASYLLGGLWLTAIVVRDRQRL